MKLILTVPMLVLAACGPTADTEDDAPTVPTATTTTITVSPHARPVPPLPSPTICPRDDAGIAATVAPQ